MATYYKTIDPAPRDSEESRSIAEIIQKYALEEASLSELERVVETEQDRAMGLEELRRLRELCARIKRL